MPLTPKQICFARQYAHHKNALAAYKASYGCHKMNKTLIAKKAADLLKKESVQDYLKRLEKQEKEAPPKPLSKNQPARPAIPPDTKNVKSTAPDKDGIIHMLVAAYEKASEDKRGASAMISACLAIAKLEGMMKDQDEHTAINTPHLKTLIKNIQKARKRLNKNKSQPPPTRNTTQLKQGRNNDEKSQH